MRSFIRLVFRCWLAIASGMLVILVALGTRGEPVQWLSVTTWYALVYAVCIAGIGAIVPATLLAGLLSAALVKRSMSIRRSDVNCETGRNTPITPPERH